MLNTIPATDFSAFFAPVQKIIDLNTTVVTKAFEAQKAAAQSQAALFQARAKAAMQIKDVEGLTAFVTEQSEIAKTSLAELTETSKIAAEEVKAYFAEVQALMSETQAKAKDVAVKKAAAAPKKAA